MPPKSLTISAIIPLYNGQRFIGQALTSIANQTLPAHEVIVVDDGSTDDGLATVEQFARTYPVKILRKRNGGQSSARNFGIAGSGIGNIFQEFVVRKLTPHARDPQPRNP